MDFEDRFDYDFLVNYKGFDLSEFDDSELPELLDKIDFIHHNMKSMNEICKKLVEYGKPVSVGFQDKVISEAIKLYGEQDGREFSRLVLGKIEKNAITRQVATARAFQISFERQFEDEDSEPIDPYEFEDTDIFKIMKKLTGGENPLPDLLD